MAKINFKKIAIVIGIFTLLDYLLHLYGNNIPVFPNLGELPQFYFIGKVIVLAIAIPIVMRIKQLNTLFKQCIVLAILLQVRYYFTIPYSLTTQISMVVIHYILLRISFKSEEYVKNE